MTESLALTNDPRALARRDSNQMILALLMAMAAMLFAAFTASYIIRRTGTDWVDLPMPGVLWITTALLLSSSVTMEMARRHAGRPGLWFRATLILALCFAAGQALAWAQLQAGGAFTGSSPQRAFLVMLAGVHGAHLLGGIVMGVVAARPGRAHLIGLCAAWWHFVGALWLYVVGLLWLF